MRFLRAFVIALITAIVGGFIAIFASDYLTKLYHVSDMEGGRGMAVVFLFGPLGFILGLVIGAIVAFRSHRSGFAGFLFAQGLSILCTFALAAVVSGFAWLGADHPPKIGGKNVALEFEVKIPTAISLPAELNDYSLRANLYSSNRDNRYANIDIRSVRRQESFTIVPGSAVLISRAANRSLLVSIGDEPRPSQLFELANLPQAPSAETDWSDWLTANQYADLKPIPERERMSLRYRFRQTND
jgi:MFS family permease